MSLITCCPACGTMFKVVADQLKISEGWVRCGHCAQVFDATAHMVPVPQVPTAPVPPQQPIPEPPPATAPAEPVSLAPPPMALAFGPPAGVAPAPRPEAPSELPSPLDAPFIFRRSDMGEGYDLGLDSNLKSTLSLPPSDSLIEADVEPPRTGPEPELHEVSFVRDALRREFWRRPLVRGVLLLLLLASAALLALQYAIQERDRLAVVEPGLRSWLERMCVQLHCTVGPPRQIEAIAIDSSAFNRLRSDAYRLSFTLKNSASFAVAAPSMELTLTDTQDQPVVRRVLTPQELGASSPLLPAGGEWSGSVALAVNANGSGARIAGYRLLAFYP